MRKSKYTRGVFYHMGGYWAGQRKYINASLQIDSDASTHRGSPHLVGVTGALQQSYNPPLPHPIHPTPPTGV